MDKEIPKLEYLTVLDWIILVSYVYATIPNSLAPHVLMHLKLVLRTCAFQAANELLSQCQ